jgi:hypothetical protein
VPDDCVEPTELGLSWQALRFSVLCGDAEQPPLLDLAERYPELHETSADRTCVPPPWVSEPEPEPDVLFGEEPAPVAVPFQPSPVTTPPVGLRVSTEPVPERASSSQGSCALIPATNGGWPWLSLLGLLPLLCIRSLTATAARSAR